MEFDIVELWKTAVTCLRDGRRWSSTLLTGMEMGELPWKNVEGVRLDRTSYSWSMEFDIVELRKRVCHATFAVGVLHRGATE